MLTIVIPETEFYDEVKNEFRTLKEQKLVLEHSLVSISKWESKWHKPFLNKDPKTSAETIDYIKCMTVNSVDPLVYDCVTSKVINMINAYIEDSMTATTINQKGRPNREVITSELIYYWMVALNIPFECQKWHLNRLLTLINICNIKNKPSKKMSKKEIMSRNSALNAARRKALHTSG